MNHIHQSFVKKSNDVLFVYQYGKSRNATETDRSQGRCNVTEYSIESNFIT